MSASFYGSSIASIAIFLSIAALLIAGFSANVSRIRGKHKIFKGDGDNQELKNAIRGHLNFIEHYAPFAFVMTFYMFLDLKFSLTLALGFLLFKTLHSISLLSLKPSKLRYSFAGVFLLEIAVPIALLAAVL